jgi:hypothetical protein
MGTSLIPMLQSLGAFDHQGSESADTRAEEVHVPLKARVAAVDAIEGLIMAVRQKLMYGRANEWGDERSHGGV